MRACLGADAKATRELIERYQSDVFGLCFRLLRHRQDAEDVVQEVFLRVFRSLKRWDSRRPLRPWIMSIAVNRCRTWLGKRVRRPELADYLEETAPAPPADDAAELAKEIESAVAELRWEFRGVFIMYHERGLPYDEIAQAFGKPVGTIKTWLHRARLEVMDRLRRRGMMGDS